MDKLASVVIMVTMFWVRTCHSVNISTSVHQNKRLNVLLLIADDMRPEAGPFLDPEHKPWLNTHIHTPNLDSLAKRSFVSKQAFAQLARCNPSRTSFLTGRRPDTTQVVRNDQYFRETASEDIRTMPQYFKNQGYTTTAVGKIFHQHFGKPEMQDEEYSWSTPVFHSKGELNKSWMAVSDKQVLPDETVQIHASEVLHNLANEYKQTGKNFFLGVGFHKPHLPLICPKKFFKMYPTKKIAVADNDFCPYKMADKAWKPSHELLDYPDLVAYKDSWAYNSSLPDKKSKKIRKAYYSCVSYVDSLVGKVIDKLDQEGLRDDTVVVFLGDHGFHLGENNIWGKMSNFEVATHSPLMISVPGVTDKGISSNKLVELVDIFPTVIQAAGLQKPLLCPEHGAETYPFCHEGSSLLPLISDPEDANWKACVFSQDPWPNTIGTPPTFMGYSVRTPDYRYNEWVEFNLTGKPELWPSQPHYKELYDLIQDPAQNYNRADDPGYDGIIGELSVALRQGWRTALHL